MANTSFAASKKKSLTGEGCGEHGSVKDKPGLIAAAIRLTGSPDLAHWRPNPARAASANLLLGPCHAGTGCLQIFFSPAHVQIAWLFGLCWMWHCKIKHVTTTTATELLRNTVASALRRVWRSLQVGPGGLPALTSQSEEVVTGRVGGTKHFSCARN